MLNPVRIAIAHQIHMRKLADEIKANAGGIRQLLVGRVVRRRDDGSEFMVTDTRLGVGSHVNLYGTRVGPGWNGKRAVRIGLVEGVELVEVKPCP